MTVDRRRGGMQGKARGADSRRAPRGGKGGGRHETEEDVLVLDVDPFERWHRPAIAKSQASARVYKIVHADRACT